MKHLFSIFKILHIFIKDLIEEIFIPFMFVLQIAAYVWCLGVLPLSLLLYLVGVENYEVLVWSFFNNYSLTFWFCFYCYMFYQISLKGIQMLFIRLIRDIKELSQK